MTTVITAVGITMADASAPQHADSGKIHCPNLFGEFLVGP